MGVRCAGSSPHGLFRSEDGGVRWEEAEGFTQSHCGPHRINRPASDSVRIGRNLAGSAGDIVFPVVLPPRDPETLWDFPMNGTSV